MTRPHLFAITLLPVAVGTAFAVAPRAKAPGTDRTSAPKRATARSTDPVSVLVAQLHRRFSDARDADFGYARVSRPLARLHYAVTMDRNDLLYATRQSEGDVPMAMNRKLVRRTGTGDYELRTERGTWIPFDKARDQMRPENEAERRAIGSLAQSRREIAIYTFGAFDRGRAGRWHGPAYLNQLGPAAPAAERMKGTANAAWTGGKPTLPGYRLRVERIFAEASCVKCHGEMRAWPTADRGMGAKGAYKTGDALGLVVVAERL